MPFLQPMHQCQSIEGTELKENTNFENYPNKVIRDMYANETKLKSNFQYKLHTTQLTILIFQQLITLQCKYYAVC